MKDVVDGKDPVVAADAISTALRRHYELTLGRDDFGDSHRYLYHALALTLRDQLVERWRETRRRYAAENPKRVYYLSMEYLMGRSLK